MQESSKKSVLRVVSQSDGMEDAENSEDVSSTSFVMAHRRCAPVSPDARTLLVRRSFRLTKWLMV
jgi:hypothetical protein